MSANPCRFDNRCSCQESTLFTATRASAPRAACACSRRPSLARTYPSAARVSASKKHMATVKAAILIANGQFTGRQGAEVDPSRTLLLMDERSLAHNTNVQKTVAGRWQGQCTTERRASG